jgi:hypothetical protein
MADLARLEALIRRLAGDRALMQRGEPGTRMGAINPTLRALGWDTDNLNEVDPEFADGGGGKVDYCLRHQGRNLVLIEAKRASADLTPHQGQLLQYAFGLGVELAALTNGLNWWLYLPMKGGRPFEERRFARVDFQEQAPNEAASALSRFLNRDEVVSGATLKEAEAEFEREERDQRVRGALPSVWRQLVTDPTDQHGEMLHDLLTEAVQSEVGYRPTREAVHQYLLDTMGPDQHPSAATRTDATPAPRARSPHRTVPESAATPSTSPVAPQPQGSRRNRPPRRIAAFWLDNRRHQATQWQDMLVGVCDLLISEAGAQFPQLVAGLRGRVRSRFAPSPDGYIRPRKLSNGMFTDTNLNANDSERRAREVLVAVRGNDDSFRIELAE